MANDLEAPGVGLRPLADLDGYEVAEGYVDVRGFDLWDEQGQVIGEVDDLLVDPSSGWARYLIVEVDEDAVAGMTNVEEVRVPVEAVRILEDEEAVRLERPIGLFAPGLVSGAARTPLSDPGPGQDDRPREPGRAGEPPAPEPEAGLRVRRRRA